MVRRENTTIFLDATEETTVFQLKKMLEGIIKKEPEELRLYNIDSKEPLDDSKTLGDCGYKSQNAKAQDPGTIGLAYKISKCGVWVGVGVNAIQFLWLLLMMCEYVCLCVDMHNKDKERLKASVTSISLLLVFR